MRQRRIELRTNDWKSFIIPFNYKRITVALATKVRLPRIELGYGRWQRPILPLYYSRMVKSGSLLHYPLTG